MNSPARPPHIVGVAFHGEVGTLLCLHCGAALQHVLPMTLADLPMVYKRGEAFTKKHRTCRNRKPDVAAVYYAEKANFTAHE